MGRILVMECNSIFFLLCFFGHVMVSLSRVGPFASAGHLGEPQVSTSYGTVQGKTVQLDSSTYIDVFRGIPHAKPPIGHLRLKKPEPPLPWKGMKNVGRDNAMCVQNMHPVTGETEDCLYLDVYRPRLTNSSQSLPVMVWIHGGGFRHGSKNSFNGSILASHDVIVVIVNYRLGPLGFLSTEDDVIPGNFGMLDQISGLKWVQSNIAAFGGDPKSVTIFGESAGSASVSLLVLSPLASGLFARAIMQSGVSSTSRAVPPPGVLVSPKQIAMAAGSKLGCHQQPGVAFLSCLQRQSVQDLFNASIKAGYSDHSSSSFRPRVETVFGFMPEYPLNLISRGHFSHVDTLRGFNAQEQGKTVSDPENDGLTREEFRKACRTQLRDFPYLDIDKYVQLMEDVYLTNVTDPVEIRSKTIEMRSDFTFIGPIVRETQVSRKHNHESKYFLYQFNYRASFVKTPEWTGVLHAADNPFVFGLSSNLAGTWHRKTTAADEEMARVMTTMWTNFAKFSNPTPHGSTQLPLVHWNQFFNNRPSYLLIDSHLQNKKFDTAENVKMLNLYESTEKEYIHALAAGNTPIIG
ncbi:fatty acyl-CoA hydrolase precursor, medium chain [Aplysia californica]|uniref:Carboxylic ester hydrolase n=1 Tax=Aplysia californica TaxID=6500 RepID=A0ABM0JH07_APLCA|nr:fatty acyl-CoA hydrolase precursor, medium chain [Aplysia californica]